MPVLATGRASERSHWHSWHGIWLFLSRGNSEETGLASLPFHLSLFCSLGKAGGFMWKGIQVVLVRSPFCSPFLLSLLSSFGHMCMFS